MNKRIKELRFEAVEYANSVKPLGITKWNEIRDNKFAELIVQECASYAEYQLQIGAFKADQIKKHFVVDK